MSLEIIYFIMDLVINNLQYLMCRKINPNQTKPEISIFDMMNCHDIHKKMILRQNHSEIWHLRNSGFSKNFLTYQEFVEI